MSYPDRTAEVGHSVKEAMEAARDAGVEVARTACGAGAEVVRTAKDEARQVAHTVVDEAQHVGTGVRQRLREEGDRQHRHAVDRVGTFAEELDAMAKERPDTPAGELIGMLAARSRSFADYLDQHGPERVLHELQEFARRRPGTFLLAAIAAGFAVGRLSKGMWQGQHEKLPS